MTRPYRQKRHDRILAGMAHPDEIRCDMMTGPLDEATRRMDRKWGVDRLPDLVSVSTAEKWGAALAKLNAAIQSGDTDATKARVEVCLRGLSAMDAEATAAGRQPANPQIWEYEYEGLRFGLVQDIDQWPAAQASRPDLQIVGLREAAIALHAMRNSLPVIAEVRKNFPGAEITKITRTANADLGGDEIPF